MDSPNVRRTNASTTNIIIISSLAVSGIAFFLIRKQILKNKANKDNQATNKETNNLQDVTTQVVLSLGALLMRAPYYGDEKYTYVNFLWQSEEHQLLALAAKIKAAAKWSNVQNKFLTVYGSALTDVINKVCSSTIQQQFYRACGVR